MLYNLLKNLITNKYYEKKDMTNKLNVFMIYNQISQEQYSELMAMINPVAPIVIEEKKEAVTQ